MKQITLKFTIARGFFPIILVWVFRHRYTHSAISLDDQTFYSFTYNGFSTERKRNYSPAKWKDDYAYYYLDVSDVTYEYLQEKIDEFVENKKSYRYTHLGLICAFLKIPYHQKHQYICSHFVADLLHFSKAYPLNRKTYLYMPNDLAKEIISCRQEEFTYR